MGQKQNRLAVYTSASLFCKNQSVRFKCKHSSHAGRQMMVMMQMNQNTVSHAPKVRGLFCNTQAVHCHNILTKLKFCLQCDEAMAKMSSTDYLDVLVLRIYANVVPLHCNSQTSI